MEEMSLFNLSSFTNSDSSLFWDHLEYQTLIFFRSWSRAVKPRLNLFHRCEAFTDSQGKPDDIQALEKKLRSLFMDLGGPQGDTLAADPASGAPVPGTSSPKGPCSTSGTSVTTPGSSQPANPPQPPSSLLLGSPLPIQGPGTPITTPSPIGRCINVVVRAGSDNNFL